MSLDPEKTKGVRPVSPTSSDGSRYTKRPPSHGESPAHLKRDKAYRRYATGVERALSLFEPTLQEWADYISFLSRLQKALQAHGDVRIVPDKRTVARRLAQCLSPSLPSGVHQKTLEVYAFIFDLIGQDGLVQDLALYLPGISSILVFASLSVRPLFLDLIQSHVLKLPSTALRPALKAIILSILPGLEEESNEDFERTVGILDAFRSVFAQSCEVEFFWQSIFLASLTSSSRRLGVLTYLSRYLPRLCKRGGDLVVVDAGAVQLESDVSAVTSPEPGLLIRCFAAGLADEQSLVQRNFLDLLITHLPLDSIIFRGRVTHEDLVLLMRAAVGVLLRRDMSLNKRLWSWLLGSDARTSRSRITPPASPGESRTIANQSSKVENGILEQERDYFIKYGLIALVQSIENMIAQDLPNPSHRVRAFRIALSLLDRWEIGGRVVVEIFVPLLRNVQSFEAKTQSKSDFEEVFRSASVFFDGVESTLIWSEIFRLVTLSAHKIMTAPYESLDNLSLARFIIMNFNVHEEEMLLVHMPMVALNQLKSQREWLRIRRTLGAIQIFQKSTDILKILVNMIPERAFTSHETSRSGLRRGRKQTQMIDNIQAMADDLYHKWHDSPDPPELSFFQDHLGDLLLQESAYLVMSLLDEEVANVLLDGHVYVLTAVISKASDLSALVEVGFIDALFNCLVTCGSQESVDSNIYAIISAITTLVTRLATHSSQITLMTQEQLYEMVSRLTASLWRYLSSTTPQYHVDVARHIGQLHDVFEDHQLVESTITSIFLAPNKDVERTQRNREASIEHFANLWAHTNVGLRTSMLGQTLMLTLDALAESSVAREWLQNQNIEEVLKAILQPMNRFLLTVSSTTVEDTEINSPCIALLQQLAGVIAVQTDEQWSVFAEPINDSMDLPTKGRTLQVSVASFCIEILHMREPILLLRQEALGLLRQLLRGPFPKSLLELTLDGLLVQHLNSSIDRQDFQYQVSLIDTILASLAVRGLQDHPSSIGRRLRPHRRAASKEIIDHTGKPPLLMEQNIGDRQRAGLTVFPSDLMACVLKGVASLPNGPFLENWMLLLREVLSSFSGSIFQVLINVTECLCKRILECFGILKALFLNDQALVGRVPEKELATLLNGLEFTIARGHERLLGDEANVVSAKTPDQPQGLFGNAVTGTFSVEGNQVRNSVANNRLTVILCFQDTIRACFSIWKWQAVPDMSSAAVASFQHISLKLRNRSRRLLGHLLEAEPTECLEALIGLWIRGTRECGIDESALVLNLLHTLDAARPRVAMPAMFNAIYSRTNPSALDKHQKSTMSSNITDAKLAAFLVQYTSSLDDDVLDEIWTDCTTFLRDILSNPMPHRQILSQLLNFIAVLGGKMENTNFGEERKMRKELGDLFVRLLTAIFTIKPGSSSGADDVVPVLCTTFPFLGHFLSESDRLLGVLMSISTNITGPILRSRLFPENVTLDILNLVHNIAKIPIATKAWKKDVIDSFNQPRFFHNTAAIARDGWLSLLRQLALSDKTMMDDLRSRLTVPASAGLVFGVGASAARFEADRKAQLNLRRIATLFLATEMDTFAGNLTPIRCKIEELLTATRVSSPSSSTRADVFLLIRAVVLKTSPTHLSQFWPEITVELHETFSSILEDQQDAYNGYSLLQAAKLLDVLLLLRPDEFQLHEWLFVTDTVDAIHRPDRWEPAALIDKVGQALEHPSITRTSQNNAVKIQNIQIPWLCSDDTRTTSEDDILDKLLRPFFAQLSIHAFEATYDSLGAVDKGACEQDLLADVFSDASIVS